LILGPRGAQSIAGNSAGAPPPAESLFSSLPLIRRRAYILE
jgi:hypothetical protein